MDRTRFPLLSLFNIEVIYNWQYQVMELNCADGRHFRLVEVQTQADIWDGLSPFPNQGPVIYELHTTY